MYVWINIHTFITSFCLSRKPRSSDTPVAISTLSTQILIYKYHSPTKELEFLKELLDYRAGAWETNKTQTPSQSEQQNQ